MDLITTNLNKRQSLHVSLIRSTNSDNRFLQQVSPSIIFLLTSVILKALAKTENIEVHKSFIGVPRTSGQDMVSKPTVVQQEVSQIVSSSSTSSQRSTDHSRTSNDINHLQFIREHYKKFYQEEHLR